MTLDPLAIRPRRDVHNALLSYETFWRDHQTWLQSCGYVLRKRYMPDWVPSWKEDTKKDWIFCEDGQAFMGHQFIDATRTSDGALVALKKVSKKAHPYEADIAKALSSEPLVSDPRNHSVPVYEILQVPDNEDLVLIVMPFLRDYDDPRFDTFGEAVAYFQQVFEGLQFMHQHLIAHRDGNSTNIMMDPTFLYPESFHPVTPNRKPNYKRGAKHYTRTQRPPKYYYIDFGLSRRYKPEDMPPLEPLIQGGDKSVPEFQESALERNPSYNCNPFLTDIYYLGNMIREDFIEHMFGFEFIYPLVAAMIQDDPEKRPTIDDVLKHFETIRNSLSTWKLRSRIVQRDEVSIVGYFRSIAHWTRRIGFVLRRVPAIPLP